jgi:hypothetical protein
MRVELERGVVFRLANISNDFPPDSEKLQPAHIALSDRDKQVAARKGLPPSLSVFDLARCSVRQAKVIRPSDHEAVGFGFQVPDILAIQVADLPGLRVVEVPLDPPESELPGADGHCGIEGLHRPEGLPNGKLLFRALRTRLADCSFRLSERHADAACESPLVTEG